MTYDKSKVTAYVLWLLIGAFGAHRFYLGRIKSGVVMCAMLLGSIVLTSFGTYVFYVAASNSEAGFISNISKLYPILLGVGSLLSIVWLIWWVLDLIFIYFMIKKDRQNAVTLSDQEASNVFG